MSHLGENLASKGYVVASIDHLESTYDDQADFASTLFHRTLDQRFVIQHLATTSASPDNFYLGWSIRKPWVWLDTPWVVLV